MTPSEKEEELAYHMQELRADLTFVCTTLDTVAMSDVVRSVFRAWIDAEVALAHDLEVHFPQALALLEVSSPLGRGIGGRDMSEPKPIAVGAGEARRLVERAIGLLPPAPASMSDAQLLSEAAGLVETAHCIVAAMRSTVPRPEKPE